MKILHIRDVELKLLVKKLAEAGDNVDYKSKSLE